MNEGSDDDLHKTIMIIDDDEDDRDFFCLAVRKVNRNIQVLCTKSGDEALDLLNNKEAVLPDYIFLDLRMPKMDGKQTLVELRKLEKLTSTPIVIYSTTRSNQEETEVKQLGAQYFLTKPYRFNDLVERISSYIHQSDNGGVLKNVDFRKKLTG